MHLMWPRLNDQCRIMPKCLMDASALGFHLLSCCINSMPASLYTSVGRGVAGVRVVFHSRQSGPL